MPLARKTTREGSQSRSIAEENRANTRTTAAPAATMPWIGPLLAAITATVGKKSAYGAQWSDSQSRSVGTAAPSHHPNVQQIALRPVKGVSQNRSIHRFMRCVLLRVICGEATFFDETEFRALRDILDTPRGLHSFALCYSELGSQEIVKRHNRQRSAVFAIGDNDDPILRFD